MDKRVNYNEIASCYNRRYQLNDLEGISASLEKIINQNGYKTILEVGCGTGHWLEKIHNNNRTTFGCDLSTGMLKKAAGRESFLFCCNADFLALKKQKFDFIYCVNALHFFDNKKEFISNIKECLKPGGALGIVSVDPRCESDSWYIYDYFNGMYQNDLYRFISWDELKRIFRDSGFINIDFKIADKVNKELTCENVLSDYFLNKLGSSQLAALSDEEYETGINRIKKEIEKNPHHVFTSRISFAVISGQNISS